MSHSKVTKLIQNGGDKGRGRFSFREEENIRVVCSDQIPEPTDYSKARNPSAVLGY
jgi:hypothetical protein